MDLSVCICSYQRYDLLPKAIESASKQDTGLNFEVIVVDNSPDAERAQVFAQQYKDLKNVRFHYESTPGLSNARNVGLRLSSAPIISYLDDDAIASRSWVQEVYRAFQAFPDVGVVGGRIEPIWEKPRPDWLSDRFLGAFSVVDWGGSLRIADDQEWIAGANISFSTKALEEAGAFPTSLGRVGGGSVLLSNEAIDVLEKVQTMGFKRLYAPDASVRHLVPANRMTQSWLKRRYAWQAISDFIKDADQGMLDGEVFWRGLVHEATKLPPQHHTLRGLFFEAQNADDFDTQIGMTYNSIMAILMGHVIKADEYV